MKILPIVPSIVFSFEVSNSDLTARFKLGITATTEMVQISLQPQSLTNLSICLGIFNGFC